METRCENVAWIWSNDLSLGSKSEFGY